MPADITDDATNRDCRVLGGYGGKRGRLMAGWVNSAQWGDNSGLHVVFDKGKSRAISTNVSPDANGIPGYIPYPFRAESSLFFVA